MLWMQPGQRIHFHEIRPASGIAPQIDSASIATVEQSPHTEGDVFGGAYFIVMLGMNQPIFDQLFASFLVHIRIGMRLGPGAKDDFQRSQHPRRIARTRNAHREFSARQIGFYENSLLVSA
jgi:hypothetical protein